jgi:hypothetical protein
MAAAAVSALVLLHPPATGAARPRLMLFPAPPAAVAPALAVRAVEAVVGTAAAAMPPAVAAAAVAAPIDGMVRRTAVTGALRRPRLAQTLGRVTICLHGVLVNL